MDFQVGLFSRNICRASSSNRNMQLNQHLLGTGQLRGKLALIICGFVCILNVQGGIVKITERLQ